MAAEVSRSIDRNRLTERVPLYSKRNQVWLCRYEGDEVVVKEFSRAEDYWREKEIYRFLLSHAPELCPEVMEFADEDKCLILPYVSSVTVLEALEKAEKERNIEAGTEILHQVLLWLQDFYAYQRLEGCSWVMGDINLRNFLWTDHRVIGIDFEGCREGDSCEEIFRLMAYYLLYMPERTAYKTSVVQSLLEPILQMTHCSVQSFWETVDEEMKKIRDRRQNIR